MAKFRYLTFDMRKKCLISDMGTPVSPPHGFLERTERITPVHDIPKISFSLLELKLIR